MICGAPLVPVVTSGSVEALSTYATDESLALADEHREVFQQLSQALAPSIRVLRLLGEGGMGLVFLARDASLKRDVAVKVLAPIVAGDETARARFKREAEAAAAVQHPNVVGVYQVGELPRSQLPFFVMQYVEGPTLADARGRVLPEARVRRLFTDVAEALAAAHRRKVVHRDVKPGNVILDGESGRAVVLDFGIAAALHSRRRSSSMSLRLTSEGMYLGTPTYMSPEQASGDVVTEKSDVYSLGVLAYELLVGAPPFEGNIAQVLSAQVRDRPPSLHDRRPDVSDELAAAIERCLEKDPARRPAAEELLAFLEPGEKPRLEWPPPGLARLRRAAARLSVAMGMLATSVFAFFVVLALQPTARGSAVPWVLGQGAGDVRALWSLLLVACVALALALLVMFASRAWAALRPLLGALRAGYPWRVAADVAADFDHGAHELVNGLGDFTFVAERDRQALLRLRRLRAYAVAGGALLALVTLIAWGGGLAGGWVSGSDRLLPMVEAVPILVVLGLPLAAYIACGIPEWRARRRESGELIPRRRSDPSVQPELVRSWLTASRIEAPRGPLRRRALRLVIGGATGVLCLAAAAAAIAVTCVVAATTLRVTPARAAAGVWVAAVRAPTSAALAATLGRDALPALFADPGDERALRLVADRRLGEDARLAVAAATAAGYCLDAREVLFGVSPARLALLDSAADALADAPRSAAEVRRWREWMAAHPGADVPLPPDLVAPVARAPLAARALALTGMSGAAARLTACGE